VSADESDAADDREVHLEATVAIAVVIALQAALAGVSLARGWQLWGLPGWVWLLPIGPEIGLLAALTLHLRRHRTEQRGTRRRITLWLVALIAVFNALALVALIGSLLTSQERSGSELLFKAITIWSTNVVAFGLIFWELDAGGPLRRLAGGERRPDFQFPQTEDPTVAPPGWHPRLFDYVYLSFTNSIAFSPTDVMPLTARAKAFMLVESAISATTVLLAAARAVNILR
jgi:uncharacterized membrane protein